MVASFLFQFKTLQIFEQNFFFEAISSILDSLEDMQYLTDYFDTDCNFLDDIFEDKRIHSLLEVKFHQSFLNKIFPKYFYVQTII